MQISRVSYLEALKRMDMENSNLLTGVVPLFLPETNTEYYINFYMYFNPSKGQIYVTGNPIRITLVSPRQPSSLQLFDFHLEYEGYLFSNIKAGKVERLFSKFKLFMLEESERHNVIVELKNSLFVEKDRICNLLSDNGKIGLSKHPQHLEQSYSDFYDTKMVPLPVDAVRTPESRWKKRSSRKI